MVKDPCEATITKRLACQWSNQQLVAMSFLSSFFFFSLLCFKNQIQNSFIIFLWLFFTPSQFTIVFIFFTINSFSLSNSLYYTFTLCFTSLVSHFYIISIFLFWFTDFTTTSPLSSPRRFRRLHHLSLLVFFFFSLSLTKKSLLTYT